MMGKIKEILPLTLFFITYYCYGFFQATSILVISTFLFLIIGYYQTPKPLKTYTSELILISLGCLTLFTRNELFLVWKPTVMYLFTASSLLISQKVYKTSLIEKALGMADLTAPNYHWYKLDLSIAAIFILLSIANLQVFYYFGLDVWVKYKFYSIFALIALLFPIILHIESKSIPNENT